MAGEAISKRCGRCERNLPFDAFTRSKQYPDGHKAYCKECYRSYEASRRQGPSGWKIREADRIRRQENLDNRRAIEKRAYEVRRSNSSYLSIHRQQASARNSEAYKASNPVKSCVICGCEYCNLFSRQSSKPTCSDACSRELSSRGRWKKNSKRRAIVRGADADRIDVHAIFERDGWQCQQCGIATPKEKRGLYHSDSPELDHIIPLSKGGSHTYGNVQCLCRHCNMRKGAKLHNCK